LRGSLLSRQLTGAGGVVAEPTELLVGGALGGLAVGLPRGEHVEEGDGELPGCRHPR